MFVLSCVAHTHVVTSFLFVVLFSASGVVCIHVVVSFVCDCSCYCFFFVVVSADQVVRLTVRRTLSCVDQNRM